MAVRECVPKISKANSMTNLILLLGMLGTSFTRNCMNSWKPIWAKIDVASLNNFLLDELIS